MGTAAEAIFYLSSNLMNLSLINFAESGLNQFGVKKKFLQNWKGPTPLAKNGRQIGPLFFKEKVAQYG